MNWMMSSLLIVILLVPVAVGATGCVEAPSGRFRPAFKMSMEHGCREPRRIRRVERWVEPPGDAAMIRNERHRSAAIGDAAPAPEPEPPRARERERDEGEDAGAGEAEHAGESEESADSGDDREADDGEPPVTKKKGKKKKSKSKAADE